MAQIDPANLLVTLGSTALDYMNAALGLMFIYVAFKSIGPGVSAGAGNAWDFLTGKNKTPKTPDQKRPSTVTGFSGFLMPEKSSGFLSKATKAYLFWDANPADEDVKKYEISVKRPGGRVSQAIVIKVVNASYPKTSPLEIDFSSYAAFRGLPDNPVLEFYIKAINNVKKSWRASCVCEQQDSSRPTVKVAELTQLSNKLKVFETLRDDFVKLRTDIIIPLTPSTKNDFVRLVGEYNSQKDEIKNLINDVRGDFTNLKSFQISLLQNYTINYIGLQRSIVNTINYVRTLP